MTLFKGKSQRALLKGARRLMWTRMNEVVSDWKEAEDLKLEAFSLATNSKQRAALFPR